MSNFPSPTQYDKLSVNYEPFNFAQSPPKPMNTEVLAAVRAELDCIKIVMQIEIIMMSSIQFKDYLKTRRKGCA